MTLECVEIPGLYFIGEVVDVTGQLGGYPVGLGIGLRFCHARRRDQALTISSPQSTSPSIFSERRVARPGLLSID